MERMAAVDRNVLRIAAFELVHTDTPHRVVIDEAIELARDFGSERSPAFVNGVLDAIARELGDERDAAGGLADAVEADA
jgi:N utilization substance protein B